MVYRKREVRFVVLVVIVMRCWQADRRATPEGWLDKPPEAQPGAESIARRAREHGAEPNLTS